MYKTIQIGNQTWMAENLRTTKQNNGARITLVTNDSIWSRALFNEYYCWYDNDSLNKNAFGALYNMISIGSICPIGWHVPSDLEWADLLNYFGDQSNAGRNLIRSGFTGVAGGFCDEYYGKFQDLNYSGNWWSSSSTGIPNNYYSLVMENNFSKTRQGAKFASAGLSIRCVKD